MVVLAYTRRIKLAILSAGEPFRTMVVMLAVVTFVPDLTLIAPKLLYRK